MSKHIKSDLPSAPLERILKEITGLLVSASAVDELKRVLIEISEEIATDAADLSRHAGRKTIKDKDIDLAYKNLMKKVR